MNLLNRLFWKSIPKPQRKILLSLIPEPNRQLVNRILSANTSFPLTFDAKQCIFIHVPKVAGISIMNALGFQNEHTWHLPLKYYEAISPKKFDEYFKFGFVRNPWDRLFSAYHFLHQGGISQKDEPLTKVIQKYGSFEDFVLYWLSKESANKFIHLTPMYTFFEDRYGEVSADFVGKFENLNSDFEVVRKKLKIRSKLPHKNVSNKSTSYSSVYTKKMIDKVADIYERDIYEFNYDFD